MGKLRIIAVGEVKTAKDGRGFFPVTFREGFGLKQGTRNFWQQFKRDKVTGLPTKELYWERGTPEEAIEAMNDKTVLDGRKVTLAVKPYQIPGSDRTASTYSTIVFADENMLTVFKNAGHEVIADEDGVPLKEEGSPALATNSEVAASVLESAAQN